MEDFLTDDDRRRFLMDDAQGLLRTVGELRAIKAELLDACKKAGRALGVVENTARMVFPDLRRALRTAIAKAEGE